MKPPRPDVSRETLQSAGGDHSAGGEDVVEQPTPGVVAYLGSAFEQLSRFAELLAGEGVRRGLVGPREPERLWSRHILNSAALAQLLPGEGRVIDVGSGAGLPGVVLASVRPDLELVLLEPMERRARWLREVVEVLGLDSVDVIRARAEDVHGKLLGDAVVARAVAPLDRLVPWTLPLLRTGGFLLAIKGRRAAAEGRSAAGTISRLGGGPPEVLEAGTVPGIAPTTVVRVVVQRPRREPSTSELHRRAKRSVTGGSM